MKPERIKEIVEEKWELELRVSGCINFKKDDLESLITQALAEREAEIVKMADEMRIQAEAYRWNGEYALFRLIGKIESQEKG